MSRGNIYGQKNDGGRCECPSCGSRFSGLTAFDMHLQPTKIRYVDGYSGPWCRPSADVGLVQDGSVWRFPADDEYDHRSRAVA